MCFLSFWVSLQNTIANYSIKIPEKRKWMDKFRNSNEEKRIKNFIRVNLQLNLTAGYTALKPVYIVNVPLSKNGFRSSIFWPASFTRLSLAVRAELPPSASFTKYVSFL